MPRAARLGPASQRRNAAVRLLDDAVVDGLGYSGTVGAQAVEVAGRVGVEEVGPSTVRAKSLAWSKVTPPSCREAVTSVRQGTDRRTPGDTTPVCRALAQVRDKPRPGAHGREGRPSRCAVRRRPRSATTSRAGASTTWTSSAADPRPRTSCAERPPGQSLSPRREAAPAYAALVARSAQAYISGAVCRRPGQGSARVFEGIT